MGLGCEFMEKNGLLLCSIGLLVFMFSGGDVLAWKNIFSMVTGIFLIGTGFILIKKAKKNNV